MPKHEQHEEEQEWSFKSLFVPLTTVKAIHFIIIIGFLVFGNMLFNGFVWDDLTYVIRNPNMQMIDLFYSFGPNMFNSSGQYRPIPAFYFSVLYTWFGNAPFLFHLIQLVLHLCCVIMVYLIFSKFFKTGLAFFLSVVFLVHPINVESVSYFGQTVSPLNFLFGILAFYFAMKKTLSIRRIVIIFSLVLLSLLTKETGILFIVLILAYRVLYMQNNIVKLSIGSAITVGIYAVLRIFVGEVFLTIRYLVPIASASLYERLLTFPMIMFYYLKTFFFPVTLVIDQIWVIRTPEFSTVIFPLIVDVLFIVLAIIVGIYIWKRNKQGFKMYLFFSVWYLVGFLFIANIFPLDATVADRWFYFPMIGLLGMIGIILHIFLGKVTRRKAIIVFLAVVIVCLLSTRTILRNTNWHDVFTLYHHDRQVMDNFHIENNLGFEYSNINDNENALKHFKRSVALRSHEGNLRNLGLSYLKAGDITNARKYLEQAYQTDSHNVYAPNKHDELTYQSLAAFMLLHEDPQKANDFMEIALADYPSDPSFWILYTLNKTRLPDKQAALDTAKKAMEVLPQNKDIVRLYTTLEADKPYTFYYAGKEYTFN